jgi:hypothetical protein
LSPTISHTGSSATVVQARVKRTAGSGWDGRLYYTTSGHGISESYRKGISDSTITDEYVTLEWDMANLTAGGTDWIDSTITSIRLDLGATSSDVFEVEWITIGNYPVIIASDQISMVEIVPGDVGAAGDNAKAVSLRAGSNIIVYDKDGLNPDVSSITLTAESQNFVDAYFKFTGGGSAFTDETSWTDGTTANSDTATFTVPSSHSSTPYTFTVEVKEGSSGDIVATDTITIAAVKPGEDGVIGEDAYTVLLTNEAHTLPTTNTGTVTHTGSGTDIIVYKGATQLNSVSGTPSTGEFSVTSASGPNITVGSITVDNGSPDTKKEATVADHSNMTANQVSITYTLNIEDSISITKIQSLSKSIQGDDGGTGLTGPAGDAAISGFLTNESVQLNSFANGGVTDYSPATGSFKIFSGDTDVSTNFTLSTVSNPQSLTVSYTNQTYSVTAGFDDSEDTATLLIRATGSGSYSGITLDKTFTLSKAKGGYEIVTSLPTTNLFEGRVVFLTTDDKLYRYTTASGWTAAVPAADITGQITTTQITDNAITTAKINANAVTASEIAANAVTATEINANAVTADKIAAGAVTAAKINVTNLAAINADLGTVTAGTIQSATTGERLVITQDVITVYDSSNTVRIKIGDLS